MSNSISLPFLIIATGTILFVYMSVVIMELRSAYEESFWKQALKIGGIIFTLITLLFLGLDFVLTRFREKAFLLAPGMPILGIILVYMRSIALAWRWRKRNPSHALIRMKRRGGFLKAVGAVILSVDGVPIQNRKRLLWSERAYIFFPGSTGWKWRDIPCGTSCRIYRLFQVRESSRSGRSDLPAAGAIYSAMNRRAESLK